jgi:CDP-diacylglycerol--glycerol-3-phosphate 3-phosphatidyltransferase
MNTPNKLTVLRMILVPVFMAFMMIDIESIPLVVIGLVVFIVASITDAVDGHMARKYNLVTDFGKFMDPLADKMLTTAAFLVLAHHGRASVIAVMLILTREFIVSGIRLVAAGGGKVIAASWWGKIKTIFQMVAIIASILLLFPIFPESASAAVTDILVWISAAVTVISGADYVVKNIDVIKDVK